MVIFLAVAVLSGLVLGLMMAWRDCGRVTGVSREELKPREELVPELQLREEHVPGLQIEHPRNDKWRKWEMLVNGVPVVGLLWMGFGDCQMGMYVFWFGVSMYVPVVVYNGTVKILATRMTPEEFDVLWTEYQELVPRMGWIGIASHGNNLITWKEDRDFPIEWTRNPFVKVSDLILNDKHDGGGITRVTIAIRLSFRDQTTWDTFLQRESDFKSHLAAKDEHVDLQLTTNLPPTRTICISTDVWWATLPMYTVSCSLLLYYPFVQLLEWQTSPIRISLTKTAGISHQSMQSNW